MSKSNQDTVVGKIIGLWRYPVKSMGAEPLEEANVTWYGVEGDRRWAFVRPGVKQSGFPWLTLRQRADMNNYRPFYTDSENIKTSPTMVKTPSGDVFDVTDPELGTELLPGAQVIRQNRGIFDAFPLSLITPQTIARIGQMVSRELDVLRFRPNLLVEPVADQPFIEDDWVGCVLRVGDMRMRVDKRDGRCAVITIDPSTAERAPEVLRTVVDERSGCLGVYGTIVEPGRVALNDVVVVEASQ